MRRPKLKLGSLMIIIAVIAVILQLYVRYDNFTSKSKFHAAESVKHSIRFIDIKTGVTTVSWGTTLSEWHDQLAEKYRLAARHPWLPVAPDPPKPY